MSRKSFVNSLDNPLAKLSLSGLTQSTASTNSFFPGVVRNYLTLQLPETLMGKQDYQTLLKEKLETEIFIMDFVKIQHISGDLQSTCIYRAVSTASHEHPKAVHFF